MRFNRKQRISFIIFFTLLMSGAGISACKTISTESTTSLSSAGSRFAAGTKGVKIITSDTVGGSFGVPTAVPTATPIPLTYPGGDGTTTYIPGISASTYYDLDGTTSISQPNWLLDFQVGISSTSYTGACAAFGGGVSNLDPANYYRVSEFDCGATQCSGGSCNGSGTGTDPVFMRIVLDRDTAKIGSAENLLVQVEYQASGLHLNSDGTGVNAEDNLDQLWKIYWNSSLAASVTPKVFGVFIPPNYSACLSAGTGNTGAPGSCPNGVANTYRGSPVKVRQFIIPLSAYPTLKVIQLSRVKSRITATAPDNYVADFCDTNEPLCLGVVVRSVTLMRL